MQMKTWQSNYYHRRITRQSPAQIAQSVSVVSMIQFHCPHCERRIRVREKHVGKHGECNGCGRRIKIPLESEQRAAKVKTMSEAEKSLKDELFGFWKKHEERRLRDNHRFGMKMKYASSDIPEDEEDMKIENNSRRTINNGIPGWAAVLMLGTALLGPEAYKKLTAETPPAAPAATAPAATPAASIPTVEQIQALKKLISEEYDVVFEYEDGTPASVQRVNEQGEPIPYSPIKVKKGEE